MNDQEDFSRKRLLSSPKLSAMDYFKSNVKKFDFKRFINRLFPLTVWIPLYNLEKLRGDIIAGVTVGIMVIPQSIAFAVLANLPPEYGLYAALTPGITYFLLGTSKDVSMGPTVTMALFTYRFNATKQPVGASTLAFFLGLILISMSVLRLGFVTKFMPSHVISGFVSAAAIVIATTQLKTLFGYKSTSSTFIDKIIDLKFIKNANPWDISLGVFSLVFLAFFMVMSRTVLKRPTDDKASMVKKIGLKVLNFLCVARSALICVIGTVVAFMFYDHGYTDGFTLAGDLPKGLPTPQIPLRSVTFENSMNQTTTLGTTDFLDGFGAALIVLPLIQFIQNISVAKAFGKLYKYEIDSTQELLALGVANFVGSFFGGWPVTGSFSRSAVNAMSGTRTPFSGVISCIIVFFAVSFLTPVFFYIPKTALSAMIIMAVVTMVDFSVPKQIWRVHKVDLIPYLITFLGTFYKLEMGVLVGAAVALLIMVSREVKPKFDTDVADPTTAYIKMKGNLSYPAVDIFKSRISKLMKANPGLKAIYINMHAIQHVDYGVVVGLKNIVQDIEAEEIQVYFTNCSKDSIKKALQKGGILKVEEDIESLPSSSRMPLDNYDDETKSKGSFSRTSSANSRASLSKKASPSASPNSIHIEIETPRQNEAEKKMGDASVDVHLEMDTIDKRNSRIEDDVEEKSLIKEDHNEIEDERC